MRLWLNRSAEVSLREQLNTQVVLGILTREILPGQKLPSTRELARRFGIHPNTASACYRELERDGWLEFRHGSGVFVANTRPSVSLSPEMAVDQLIGELAARARKIGASDSLLRARLRRWLSLAPLARWLVIEPDPELRKIVTVEMESSLALPVASCTPDECSEETQIARSIPVCLPSKAAAVRKLLPAGTVLTAGAHTLTATFTPSDSRDYATASVSVILQVNQATPAIVWPVPSPVAVGAVLSSTQLNATVKGVDGNTLPGSTVYAQTAGSVLSSPGA